MPFLLELEFIVDLLVDPDTEVVRPSRGRAGPDDDRNFISNGLFYNLACPWSHS